MATSPLITERLARHGITAPRTGTVADTVCHLCAMQAQDYHASLWAVGLRTQGATVGDVEAALARGDIVRTWPMRGTLHLVAAEDVRWMLALMASRVQALDAARIQRDYGLDSATLARCRRVIEQALAGGTPVTRNALYARLDDAGIDSSGQRGLHVLGWLAHAGLICQGPREGKQPTFVWLDAWIPATPLPSRDASLAMLAERYLRSHAPATAHDLAWWSGLTLKDARLALELAGRNVDSETVDGVTWWRTDGDFAARVQAAPRSRLLPAFDEYVIGYKDREPVVDASNLRRVIGINGLVSPTVVLDGRVAATWKRETGAREAALSVAPLRPLTATDLKHLRPAARRYGAFIGVPVRLADA